MMSHLYMSARKPFERFGDYLLLHRIAVGGMAEVYLAHPTGDPDPQRLVVVKRLLKKYCRDPEFIKMFHDEERVIARLSHPSIIQVLDYGLQRFPEDPMLTRLLGAGDSDGLGSAELDMLRSLGYVE